MEFCRQLSLLNRLFRKLFILKTNKNENKNSKNRLRAFFNGKYIHGFGTGNRGAWNGIRCIGSTAAHRNDGPD